MPNSLKPFPPETRETTLDMQVTKRIPLRKRIVKHLNGFDVNMPTRTRVPSRSVTPIY